VKHYALSLKQPWAALLVAGIKTIEVRKWPTARRGRILIHAARVPDDRREGWELITPRLLDCAQLQGGIIGVANLIDCFAYRSVEAFAADRERHRNDPAWFVGPVLYGFRFDKAEALPYSPYPGWMRFFEVDGPEPKRA
jgi:hypothetical protein